MNILCNVFGRHKWKIWSETDRALGYHFDYMKCERPGCKWHGLTWVSKERISA